MLSFAIAFPCAIAAAIVRRLLTADPAFRLPLRDILHLNIRGRRLWIATFRASPVHLGEHGKADRTIAE
jgi:hypothetical protein